MQLSDTLNELPVHIRITHLTNVIGRLSLLFVVWDRGTNASDVLPDTAIGVVTTDPIFETGRCATVVVATDTADRAIVADPEVLTFLLGEVPRVVELGW